VRHTIDIEHQQCAAIKGGGSRGAAPAGNETGARSEACCKGSLRMLRAVLGASGPAGGGPGFASAAPAGLRGDSGAPCWDPIAEGLLGSGVDLQ